MKNLLIIASLYGSKRVLGLARYLPQFGWSPTIITPPVRWQPTIITPADRKIPSLPFNVIETDYRDTNGFLKKLLGTDTTEDAKIKARKLLHANSQYSWVNKLFALGGMVLNYPDSHKGWRRHALDAGDTYLRNNKVDALLSICPVTSHIVAHELKARYNIFWVADFPDLWSQNINYSYGPIRRVIDRRLEIKTMRNVDIIVSSSMLCAERQGSLHTGKPAHVITLGYDPQDYDTRPVILDLKFTITYTGRIYEGRQNPDRFLIALYELIASGHVDRTDCSVQFYGEQLNCVSNTVDRLGLSDIVHLRNTIPHDDIVDVQRKSQVLLLLDWDDPSELGAYTAKVFEYIGAKRPILATGGIHGNAISALLEATNAGVHAPSTGEIKGAIIKYYQEYKGTRQAEYRTTELERQKYSQLVMAGKFAALLPRVSKKC